MGEFCTRAISLGFHDVSGEERAQHAGEIREAAGHYTLSVRRFRDHLNGIKMAQHRGRAGELPAHIRPGAIVTSRPVQHGTPIYLTFDDGGVGGYLYAADSLEEFGWRGHFFITTDWIGRSRFMSARQIRDLHARGHVIGSHTCSHPSRMSALSDRELRKEWGESCRILADMVGAEIVTASVADGYYSHRVGEAARDCGLEYLFTSEPTEFVEAIGATRILGRYAVKAGDHARLSGRLVAGAVIPRWRQAWSWQGKKVLKRIGGSRYLALRRAVFQHVSRNG